MTLQKLNIHNVRNLEQLSFTPHHKFNLITGANGSGKTSILEAIYLLGNGRSFRSRETTPIVNFNAEALTVFAEIAKEDTISIQKSKHGTTKVKINHQTCSKTSQLAKLVPCQIIYQDLFQIMDAGPNLRRNLLDWGCFYQFKDYKNIFNDYRHIIKQRNALLRQQAANADFKPWDKLLVTSAEQIAAYRAEYFTALAAQFAKFLARLSSVDCTISYFKGWDRKEQNQALMDILQAQLSSDRQRQYTHSGAHNADIIFHSTQLKAKQTLSRGQQKIILIALKLAQAQLLTTNCTYLLDDLSSELDKKHLGNLFKVIKEIDGQFFITSVDAQIFQANFASSEYQHLQLHDGKITEF